jgi:hypothetical protein
MAKKNEETGLNPNQEKFCHCYVSKEFFAHGVESYAEAYGINLDNKTYNTCKVQASKLLTNPNILSRIRQLLDLSGLNDEYVDREMLFVITQNSDLNAKMKGIDSYNKLKSRIVEKTEATLKGNIDITMKLE